MIVTLEKKTTEEFLRTLILNKHLKADFSFNGLIYGVSGAGKSSFALRVAEAICDGKKGDMKHICDEHIIYTPLDFDRVLKHVFKENCDIPLLIYMEAREVLDARRFMSELNLHITRIAQLARRVKLTCNLFCVQREKDIDIRTRALINVGFEIRRYGLSSGKSTRAYAVPYTAKELIKEDRELRKPDVYISVNGILERTTMLLWEVPEIFSYFYDVDRQKKSELIFGSGRNSKEKEKEEVKFEKELEEKTEVCPKCQHRYTVFYPVVKMVKEEKKRRK